METIAIEFLRRDIDLFTNSKRSGRPHDVRAVANAVGQNLLLFVLPCHRINRKDGHLSSFRAGIALKEKLLKLENTKLEVS